MLYLDTSAALKLVREEDETAALADFLDAENDALVTSRVGVVELRRVARRGDASADRADALAASLDVIEVDRRVEALAATLDPQLRTLDALHLASALAAEDAIGGFVCYDVRLGDAAAGAGLPVIAPGRSG